MTLTTQQEKRIDRLIQYHGIPDASYHFDLSDDGSIVLRIVCINDIYGEGVEVHVYTINRNGHLHSIGDNAAHTAYRANIDDFSQYNPNDSGQSSLEVYEINYCKNNRYHRTQNRFSRMHYDPDLGEYIYEYHVNGKLHRTDGPAKDSISIREYYLNGVELTKEDVVMHNFMNKIKVEVQ
jgi:hypothetical protein